jgi:hypothetical protein
MCVGNMILPADIAHMPLFWCRHRRARQSLWNLEDTRVRSCIGETRGVRGWQSGISEGCPRPEGLELMHVYFRTVLNLMTFKSECNGWEIRFPPPPVDERGRNIPLRTDKVSERIDNFILMSRIFIVFPILARGAKQRPLFRYTVHLNADRRQICIPSTVQTGRQTKSQSTALIHMARY